MKKATNPFENINQKVNEVSLQKKEGEKIVKKKAGRPKKPNSEKLQIRQDASILARMRREAEMQGLNIGAMYGQAALFWLRNKNNP